MTRKRQEPARLHDAAGAVGSEDVEVIELNRAEYDRAVEASLKDAGLTYGQLAKQARAGHFTSLHARKLWFAIGEPGRGC
jgi:hypothetical protein